MKTLDLFAGIGGMALGLEYAGFKTAALCEYDVRCQTVLRTNWPDLSKYDVGQIDLITAGFPCQDASVANATGKGADGERTGLFREALRISREMGRTPLLLENAPKSARPFAKTDAASLQNDLEEYCFRQNDH